METKDQSSAGSVPGAEILQPGVPAVDLGGARVEEVVGRVEAVAAEVKQKQAEHEQLSSEAAELRQAGLEADKRARETEEEKSAKQVELQNLNADLARLASEYRQFYDTSRELGNKILGRENPFQLLSTRIEAEGARLDAEVRGIREDFDERIAAVKGSESQRKEEIDEKYRQKFDDLLTMVDEQLSDKEAAQRLVGKVVSDEEGKLTASNAEDMARVFGGNDEAVLRAMQTAHGGERAAEISGRQLRELMEKIDGERANVRADIDREVVNLQLNREDVIRQRRMESEAEVESLEQKREEIAKELFELRKQDQENDLRLEKADAEWRSVLEKRDQLAEQIMGAESVIARFREESDRALRNSEEILRRIPEVVSGGVDALRVLEGSAEVVSEAAAMVLANMEIAKGQLDKMENDDGRELTASFENDLAMAKAEYDASIMAIEAGIEEMPLLGITKNPEGRLVTSAVGLPDILGQAEVLQPLSEQCKELERVYREAVQEAITRRNEQEDALRSKMEAERQKLADAQEQIIQKLETAEQTLRFTVEAANDVFKTVLETPENTAAKSNLLTKALNLVTGLLSRRTK